MELLHFLLHERVSSRSMTAIPVKKRSCAGRRNRSLAHIIEQTSESGEEKEVSLNLHSDHPAKEAVDEPLDGKVVFLQSLQAVRVCQGIDCDWESGAGSGSRIGSACLTHS